MKPPGAFLSLMVLICLRPYFQGPQLQRQWRIAGPSILPSPARPRGQGGLPQHQHPGPRDWKKIQQPQAPCGPRDGHCPGAAAGSVQAPRLLTALLDYLKKLTDIIQTLICQENGIVFSWHREVRVSSLRALALMFKILNPSMEKYKHLFPFKNLPITLINWMLQHF